MKYIHTSYVQFPDYLRSMTILTVNSFPGKPSIRLLGGKYLQIYFYISFGSENLEITHSKFLSI